MLWALSVCYAYEVSFLELLKSCRSTAEVVSYCSSKRIEMDIYSISIAHDIFSPCWDALAPTNMLIILNLYRRNLYPRLPRGKLVRTSNHCSFVAWHCLKVWCISTQFTRAVSKERATKRHATQRHGDERALKQIRKRRNSTATDISAQWQKSTILWNA